MIMEKKYFKKFKKIYLITCRRIIKTKGCLKNENVDCDNCPFIHSVGNCLTTTFCCLDKESAVVYLELYKDHKK